MMKISVIVVGKLKEKHWKEAEGEFLQRLTAYAKIELIEVDSSPITATATGAQSMEIEGEKLLKRLKDDSFIVTLDRKGKRVGSQDFAGMLEKWSESGQEISFVIGGAAGLSKPVLERSNASISMSDMTFTHEMARVFLLEQLYRAGTILSGKKYHL